MSVRTGFIARGFIPFGSLTVSWGYGNYGTELIPPPTPTPVTVLLGTAVPGVKTQQFGAPGSRSRTKKIITGGYVPGNAACRVKNSKLKK